MLSARGAVPAGRQLGEGRTPDAFRRPRYPAIRRGGAEGGRQEQYWRRIDWATSCAGRFRKSKNTRFAHPPAFGSAGAQKTLARTGNEIRQFAASAEACRFDRLRRAPQFPFARTRGDGNKAH